MWDAFGGCNRRCRIHLRRDSLVTLLGRTQHVPTLHLAVFLPNCTGSSCPFRPCSSLANTRCCMQPPRRHFLFLSTKSSGPSRCDCCAACCMLPLSSRVLGPLSGLSSVSCPAACCNCFAYRACPCIRQAASPGSAHCFDSFCQIYIKFITTHVSQGMLHPAAQHFHSENVN